jgi:hypothetical protein
MATEKMDVQIRVSIRSVRGNGHRVSLTILKSGQVTPERFHIEARDFIGMCRILGEFQTLAEKLLGENAT